ncbi:MAG: helix-turn-helix domain-containing protein [Bacteroidota bacterium]
MDIRIITKDEIDALIKKLIEAFAALLKDENGAVNGSKLYTNQEARLYLNVCSKTLQNYRDNGLLRYTQVGRKIYYDQTDLNAFLETYKKKTFLEQIKHKKYGTN